MMSEVVPTTTQPVKIEKAKHDQVQNENVEDRNKKKETCWQMFLSPFNRCFKNTTDCLNFWCCKNECYNLCCNSKYIDDDEEEPNHGDEVRKVLTAISRHEETIGTFKSNATSESKSYIDSAAGEGYSHQCHTSFPVTTTNFELDNILLIAEKPSAMMQSSSDSKTDEDDKENTHAITPLRDHSGNQDGSHTGSHDGGHTGSHDGGHTESHDCGHTGSHDGGHKGSHDSGHKGSHDGGHTGSHDSGHKGSHDGGHKGSHDGGHRGCHDGGHTGSHDGGHKGSHDGGHTGRHVDGPTGHHTGGHTEIHGGGHHHTVEVHSGDNLKENSGGGCDASGAGDAGWGGDCGGGGCGDAGGGGDAGWGGDCGGGGGDY